MKKYFVYLMMALAAFTFNACGDDDPVTENREQNSPAHQMTRMTTLMIQTNLKVLTTRTHLRETATSLWPISVGEEPHSGWHSRLSNKPGLTCFV